ncbi:hypothetical protein EJ05DRAFT_488690 [Pseudovirgaria hyperparasitica]|uniref:Uncharacterized protein n=1 Tax=Pseudovirgaria hyperparasitica TaxID=470096 RepID=A0A6A6VY27_9PEZI|nr:uncharacterized protein EJ05DRAFT_488690 [Pseudovirgaria hyperparasitica]KAF2755153.1 hypothetical protein EJ05DRAFT_488690 [Pseudovirgaria hyperparasitica]
MAAGSTEDGLPLSVLDVNAPPLSSDISLYSWNWHADPEYELIGKRIRYRQFVGPTLRSGSGRGLLPGYSNSSKDRVRRVGISKAVEISPLPQDNGVSAYEADLKGYETYGTPDSSFDRKYVSERDQIGECYTYCNSIGMDHKLPLDSVSPQADHIWTSDENNGFRDTESPLEHLLGWIPTLSGRLARRHQHSIEEVACLLASMSPVPIHPGWTAGEIKSLQALRIYQQMLSTELLTLGSRQCQSG